MNSADFDESLKKSTSTAASSVVNWLTCANWMTFFNSQRYDRGIASTDLAIDCFDEVVARFDLIVAKVRG